MMMSYYYVEQKIHNYILDDSNRRETREKALVWLNDFNDAMYPRMFNIVKLLNELDDDLYDTGEIELDEEGKAYVIVCGIEFNEFGGFDFMTSMFYIMSNFMKCKRGRITEVKYLWDKIGEWKC